MKDTLHQYEKVKKSSKRNDKNSSHLEISQSMGQCCGIGQRKDGLLRFCIDVMKLKVRTIKDAYSHPCIEESLDCLNGAWIFTSFDLKSGYWQLELSEESIPLTAFTVGPLGFYECVHMPFGLTNAPVTFQ